jgi:hypothetical protein
VVGLDVHDVVVSGHRPVWTEHAVPGVVNRLLLAQPVEIRPERIGAEQLGIAGVEFTERQRVGALARGLGGRILGEINGPVHGVSSCVVPLPLQPLEVCFEANYIPLCLFAQGQRCHESTGRRLVFQPIGCFCS